MTVVLFNVSSPPFPSSRLVSDGTLEVLKARETERREQDVVEQPHTKTPAQPFDTLISDDRS